MVDLKAIAQKLFDDGFEAAIGVVQMIRDEVATGPTTDEEFRRVSVATLDITIAKMRASLESQSTK